MRIPNSKLKSIVFDWLHFYELFVTLQSCPWAASNKHSTRSLLPINTKFGCVAHPNLGWNMQQMKYRRKFSRFGLNEHFVVKLLAETLVGGCYLCLYIGI